MKKSRRIKLAIIFLVAILGIFSLCLESRLNYALFVLSKVTNIVPKSDNLVVHFISVGEADAMAVSFPNGQLALIDTGSVDSANIVLNYIDNSLVNNKRDRWIDYVFISHCDSDHTGGLERIINNFDVKTIFRPRQYASYEPPIEYGFESTSDVYASTIKAIGDKGCDLNVVYDGMELNIGDVNLKFFSPLKQYSYSNDYSYYIKISYCGKSILFTGDASSEVENDIMADHYDELKSDYLKVSHHGSSNATSIDFLTCVSPKYAIINVGTNSYGHPTESTISRLTSCGVEIFRTDRDGNIVFTLGDNIYQASDRYATTQILLNWGNLCILIEIINLVVATKEFVTAIKSRLKTKKLLTKG